MSQWSPSVIFERKIDSATGLPTYAYIRPDESDRPIPLRIEEIEEIVNVIPLEDNTDCSHILRREQLMESVRIQLRGINIAPSAKDINKIKNDILYYYSRSLIQKGKAVGIVASGISASITQMTFDSGRGKANSAETGQGLTGVRNIVNAVRERKDVACLIHYSQLFNERDVVNTMKYIVEVKLSDIVTKTEILSMSTNSDVSDFKPMTLRPWHNFYLWYHGLTQFMGNTLVLRLHLNKIKMVEYSITSKIISEAIINEHISKKFEKDAASILEIIPSPFDEGIIDIIPREDIVMKLYKASQGITDPFSVSNLFIVNVLKPMIPSVRVSGIPGIKSVRYITVPIINAFKNKHMLLNPNEIEYYKELINEKLGDLYDGDNHKLARSLAFADLNRLDIVTKGIPIDRLLKIMEMSGVVCIKTFYNKLDIPIRYLLYIPSGNSINDHISNFISANVKDMTPWTEFYPGMGSKKWTRGEFIRVLGTYTYACTSGTNLIELYKIPWIDKAKTYSTNMYEIFEMLGIEAALMFIMGAISSVLKVNSHHVTLIADFMCNRGVPLGSTYSGNTRQGKGVISIVSIERAMLTFLRSAPFNMLESTSRASAAVLVGNVVPFGMEAYRFLPNISDIPKIQAKLKKYKDNKLHRIMLKDPIYAAEHLRSVDFIRTDPNTNSISDSQKRITFLPKGYTDNIKDDVKDETNKIFNDLNSNNIYINLTPNRNKDTTKDDPNIYINLAPDDEGEGATATHKLVQQTTEQTWEMAKKMETFEEYNKRVRHRTPIFNIEDMSVSIPKDDKISFAMDFSSKILSGVEIASNPLGIGGMISVAEDVIPEVQTHYLPEVIKMVNNIYNNNVNIIKQIMIGHRIKFISEKEKSGSDISVPVLFTPMPVATPNIYRSNPFARKK